MAKGWADDFSDLELCFCWDSLPSPEIRAEIIRSVQGGSETLFENNPDNPTPIFEDCFTVNGLKIDLWHCTNTGIKTVMEDVLINHDISLAKQGTLLAIKNGIVLQDSLLLQQWRTEIIFPPALSARIISSNLNVMVNCDLFLHLSRNDLVVLYGLFSGLQKRILQVLFALNDTFYCGVKNMKFAIQALTIKPDTCWDIFCQVYISTPEEATEIINNLMGDIIDMVEQHRPDIDTNAIRKNLKNPGRQMFTG